MEPILRVEGLRKYFDLGRGYTGKRAIVRAVDGVDFAVHAGETLGVVGESGSGKSTLARLLVRLLDPDRGAVLLEGRRVGEPGGMTVRAMRRQVQMVFQDSFASLNPRLPVWQSIAFGPRANGLSGRDAQSKAADLLDCVGLPPRSFMGRFPHELSGGQRQRVNIARALALEPKILILDEPVSALDKSVEAQVLNLLSELKRRLGLTYLFISHDLHVVRHISDRVLVLYLGRVVEVGAATEIFRSPRHPYTRALLSAMPSHDPGRRTEAAPLAGDPPNPIDPPSGCRFRTRCAHAEAVCERLEPALTVCSTTGGHASACHMMAPRSGHSQSAVL